MSKKMSSLFFVCEKCSHKEIPSFELNIKIEEGDIEESEFPSHCSERMRLTIGEIEVQKEASIDTDGVKWGLVEMIKLHFEKTGKNEMGEAFSIEFEKLFTNEYAFKSDLEKVNIINNNISPALVAISASKKDKEYILETSKVMIAYVIDGYKRRSIKKEKKSGPVMPGSDPIFDIQYFCTNCLEEIEIPNEEKKKILESSSDDHKLPIHCNNELEIRIKQNKAIETDKAQTDTSPIFQIPETNSEKMQVLSVGIDIGSSTSHLIFSKLYLEREQSFFNMTNRFNIINREILYEGDIINTPLIDPVTIDIPSVVEFCKSEYKKAGFKPEEVDTGAVIVTGETAKKRNASEIVELLSEDTGKFVSATAGPNFESLIAAMGSGATAMSADKQNTILSIDIGGGTSNLAISSKGEILSTSCINVGGRLLGINDDFEIWRIDDPAKLVMQELELNYQIGDIISEDDVIKISHLLAKSLIEVMIGKAESKIAKELMMTEDLDFSIPVDEIMFCGGVSELIYGGLGSYNDIGKYLASEISSYEFDIPVIEPENKIRATVIGAGSYSLSVSGSTTFFDKNIQLPLTNVPVLPVHAKKEEFSLEYMIRQIHNAFSKFDMVEGEDLVALYFKEPIIHSDRYLPEFAKSIEKALSNSIENNILILLLFAGDLGSMVGITIKNETSIQSNIMCLDELVLAEGDWVDIGAPISGKSFPVNVKSLAFNQI